MLKTKLVSYNATTSKPPKIDNLPINVVATITTHSQQSKQQVFKEKEPVEAKGVKEWQ